MRSKALGWILFLAIVLLLSFSVTSYSRTVGLVLICVRLSAIAVVSVLALRESWRYRHASGRNETPESDAGDRLLGRLRRWYYDESKRPQR